MGGCTFFGHRDSPERIKPDIQKAIVYLIEERNVRLFYVGNHGRFDTYVKDILLQLKDVYPDIEIEIVLAYYPLCPQKDSYTHYTIYPEGLEKVPLRYAIDKRNLWMLSRSDFVICYLHHHTGGAARYVKKAKGMKKTILYL